MSFPGYVYENIALVVMIPTVNAEFTKHNWHFALLGAFSNVSRPCESANMENWKHSFYNTPVRTISKLIFLIRQATENRNLEITKEI